MTGFNSFAAKLGTIAATAALAITAVEAQANGIVNGSFEVDPPNAPSWQTTGEASVRAAGSGLATDGGHVGVLGVGGPFGAASGTVFQDFTLSQAGALSYGFDAGTIFFGGFPFDVGFTFRIDDTILFNAPPVFVSDSVSFSYYPLVTRIEGSVPLAAGTHRVAFDISRSATLFGRGVAFVIDDIETQFTPSAVAAVPEPSTWAMLILGFGAVGAGMRRRPQLTLAFA